MMKPVPIPFPLSSFPGANPQESSGRIINGYTEPLGDPQQEGKGSPGDAIVWRRSPGLTQFALAGYNGYRGGLIVNNLSYECFANVALTVTSAGAVSVLGTFSGTKQITIARNQAASTNVIAVDPDNGAYLLSGGGAPSLYTAGGVLPQPNSIAYHHGYFFFSIADGRIFAGDVNATTMNSQSYTTCLSKSDIVLLRVVAYQEYLLAFTTGSCEVFQDQSNVYPKFPYTRQIVLPNGLLQASALAGDETGFDDLLWVSQDYAVWWMPQNTLSPSKVSPPDLDRLIEAASKAGKTLRASVYMYAGRKVWVLQSPDWSWEFHIVQRKWFERTSLQSTGRQGKWRGVGGHPAFNYWLMGDDLSQSLLFVDTGNYNDATTQAGAVTTHAPMLFHLESGSADDFPNRMRVPRMDFDFVVGVGAYQNRWSTAITGAASGTGGVVRLTVTKSLGFNTGDPVLVQNVGGTTEANGSWPSCTVIDATHIEIPIAFAHAYTSGGTIQNEHLAENERNPQVAISWTDDGGNVWRNPVLRSLGAVGVVKISRLSVKNTGRTGQQGRRVRLQVSDPVYTAFLHATMDATPGVK